MISRLPSVRPDVRARFATWGLVGHSLALTHTLQQASEVASFGLPVLITGPSGSGKTLLARAIHQESRRCGRFVEINAANLQPDLGRSEVFGIRKGVATNVDRRTGLLASAHQGTFFLDEVATLPADMQASLLTTIETGRFYMIGSTEPQTVDVRWIFATNQHLGQAVTSGSFRGDLRSRISVWPIEMPSLNDRIEDLEVLAPALLSRAACDLNQSAVPLTPAAVAYLEGIDWSEGNIRQLDSLLKRALVRALARGCTCIDEPELVDEPTADIIDFAEARAQWHAAWLRRRLDQFDWDVRRTARAIGVSVSQTYRWIKELGLHREEVLQASK